MVQGERRLGKREGGRTGFELAVAATHGLIFQVPTINITSIYKL